MHLNKLDNEVLFIETPLKKSFYSKYRDQKSLVPQKIYQSQTKTHSSPSDTPFLFFVIFIVQKKKGSHFFDCL